METKDKYAQLLETAKQALNDSCHGIIQDLTDDLGFSGSQVPNLKIFDIQNSLEDIAGVLVDSTVDMLNLVEVPKVVKDILKANGFDIDIITFGGNEVEASATISADVDCNTLGDMMLALPFDYEGYFDSIDTEMNCISSLLTTIEDFDSIAWENDEILIDDKSSDQYKNALDEAHNLLDKVSDLEDDLNEVMERLINQDRAEREETEIN